MCSSPARTGILLTTGFVFPFMIDTAVLFIVVDITPPGTAIAIVAAKEPGVSPNVGPPRPTIVLTAEVGFPLLIALTALLIASAVVAAAAIDDGVNTPAGVPVNIDVMAVVSILVALSFKIPLLEIGRAHV